MTKTLSYHLYDVQPYINWIYFFHAWGFAPRFASIANVHDCMGCKEAWKAQFPEEERAKAKEAAYLYKEAIELLKKFSETYSTYARIGLFEANADEDNILITTEQQGSVLFPCLRQQHLAKADKSYLCLSDFITPKQKGIDKIGLFATTVDQKMEELPIDDDYQKMLTQTLCDRLAEATTEKLHEQVRKELWGYAPHESFTPSELCNEPFQGIRPAVGYPSLPDQSVNFIIEDLLQFSKIGIQLTENGAMKPHASVCGLMFAHPQSKYFGIGKIGNDQLLDYANRRHLPTETVRKFLAANL
ncbi:MAG: vitamin B12 dependent-methionine synthase activation domain-containing protein [Bacteroidaceae bacterium]